MRAGGRVSVPVVRQAGRFCKLESRADGGRMPAVGAVHLGEQLKKRRRHGVFHLCPGNRRTRRLPLSGVLPKHPPKQKLPAASAAGNRHSTGQGPGRPSLLADAGRKTRPVCVVQTTPCRRTARRPNSAPTHRPSALPAGVVFPHPCKRSVFHRQNFVRKGGQFHMMGDKKNRFAAIPKHRIEQPVL